MTTELVTSSVVSRITQSNVSSLFPESYYRSKLFIASISANPLVAAASPVYSILERMTDATELPPILFLRKNIEHELNAFISRLNATSEHYESNTLAWYLLCVVVDELIGKSYMRLQKNPIEFTAFTPLSQPEDPIPQIRFFEIIDHMTTLPEQYIDLLEFFYYCLITGFEGKHHGQADGRIQLDNLIEKLYSLIQHHRVNKPKRLFKEPTDPPPAPQTIKPLLGISLISLGILVCGMLFSYFLLESKISFVQLNHQLVASLD